MRLKRFCVCFFPKATDAAQSPASSEESSSEEDLSSGTSPPVVEASSVEASKEALQGPRLALEEGAAGRIAAELREHAEPFADVFDEQICLEPGWLRLSPPKDKLDEVRLCDPAGAKAKEEEEVARLFSLTAAFRPRSVELPTELKPFIPDFIPAIGEVPFSQAPPRPTLSVLEAKELSSPPPQLKRRPGPGAHGPQARAERLRCRNAGLLRWLRGRAQRRYLRKARLSCSASRVAGPGPSPRCEVSATSSKTRDALAKWLSRPGGRRALRRLRRGGGSEVPRPESDASSAPRQEPSDSSSWATATEGRGADYASFVEDDASPSVAAEEQVLLLLEASPGHGDPEDDSSFFSAELSGCAEESSESGAAASACSCAEPSEGGGSPVGGPPDTAAALECFYAFLELFLEHYKENALRSSILEPAKYYYTVTGDLASCDAVEDEVASSIRSLLSACLGVSWASSSSPSSEAGLRDVWHCLEPAAWELFLDPAFFGMDFADLPALRGGPPLLCRAVPNSLDEDGRQRLVRLFARQFQLEVFLPKVYASLTEDAQAALVVLFDRYREDLHVPEPTLELHCWPQEALDVGRFARFLAWLGVVRWTDELLRDLALAPRVDTCPICYEEKLDVECLEHWNPKGDVSEHRMCGSCRFEYGQSQCPFCKEFLLKEELVDFIDKFGATIREDGRYDPFEVSIVLEEWQIHEMEFEAQPTIMRRAARLLMEDRNFRERLAANVAGHRRSWLIAAAGPVFRFWGLDQVKPLCSGGEVSTLLQDAVELLLSPLERAGEVEEASGFIYSQVLLAWCCAVRQDAAGAIPLAKLVRRIGWALVLSHARLDPLGRFRLREDLRGNTPPEQFELSHVPIWGTQGQDIVWQTFCT